jgi:hypothetical protein
MTSYDDYDDGEYDDSQENVQRNLEEEEPKSFTCRSEMVQDIISVLTSLLSANPKYDLPCLIEARPDQFTFLVTGRSKSTQARATLSLDLFDNYIVEGVGVEQEEEEAEPIQVSLHLSKLIDCLLLFGSSESTTVNLSYSTLDSIFRVTLEDSGIVTTCDIATLSLEDLEQDGSLFAAFEGVENVWSLLIKSEPLKVTVQELLDVSGANSVVVELTSRGLNLSTTGIGECTCDIEIPRTSAAFVSFSRERQAARDAGPTRWTYVFCSIFLSSFRVVISQSLSCPSVAACSHSMAPDGTSLTVITLPPSLPPSLPPPLPPSLPQSIDTILTLLITTSHTGTPPPPSTWA